MGVDSTVRGILVPNALEIPASQLEQYLPESLAMEKLPAMSDVRMGPGPVRSAVASGKGWHMTDSRPEFNLLAALDMQEANGVPLGKPRFAGTQPPEKGGPNAKK